MTPINGAAKYLVTAITIIASLIGVLYHNLDVRVTTQEEISRGVNDKLASMLETLARVDERTKYLDRK